MKKSKIAKKYGVTKEILKNNDFCVIDKNYPDLDTADVSVGAARRDMYIFIVRDENKIDIPDNYFAKYNGEKVAADIDVYYYHPVGIYIMPEEIIEVNENLTDLLCDIKNLIIQVKDARLDGITMKEYDDLILTTRNLADVIRTKKINFKIIGDK